MDEDAGITCGVATVNEGGNTTVPEVDGRLVEPMKVLLGFFSVTLPPVEFSAEFPVTLSGPVCVMSPTLVALRLPATVVVPEPNTVPPLLVVFRLPVLPLTVKVPGVPVVVKLLVLLAFNTTVNGTLSLSVTLLPVAVTVPDSALLALAKVTLSPAESSVEVPVTLNVPV